MLLIKRSFCMPITFDSIPNLSLSFFGLSYIWVLSNFQYNGVFATSSWISIHFRQGLLAHDLLIFFFFFKGLLNKEDIIRVAYNILVLLSFQYH